MSLGYLPPPEVRPAVSVDVVIFSVRAAGARSLDLQVLLAERSVAPGRGLWAIPGGFVGPGEPLEAAARRELRQVSPAPEVYLEQLYTFGGPERDPRGRVITVAYFALVSADTPMRALAEGPAAGEAVAWHSVAALPPLAFDHAEIVAYARQRLRYKLEYTAVGFELLPNVFTLSELQAAYETVLGEKLDKRNFRRRILEAEILAETELFRESEGQGRPARLYRYRKNAVTEVKARRLFP
jgi:8-oxo-dGTP diphosphatase